MNAYAAQADCTESKKWGALSAVCSAESHMPYDFHSDRRKKPFATLILGAK